MNHEWIQSLLTEIESAAHHDPERDDPEFDDLLKSLADHWTAAVRECPLTQQLVNELTSGDTSEPLKKRLNVTMKHAWEVRNARLEAQNHMRIAKNCFGMALVSLCESHQKDSEPGNTDLERIHSATDPKEVGVDFLGEIAKRYDLPVLTFISLVACSLESSFVHKRLQLMNEGIARTASKIPLEAKQRQALMAADKILQPDRKESLKFLAELTRTFATG